MVVIRIRSALCLCHAQAHLPYFKNVCFDDCRRFGCMVSFFRPIFTGHSRRHFTLYLAFFWCVGLASGAAVAVSTDPSRFSMMRAAVDSCVSITSLAGSLLLPLFFSALAVYISQIWLLVPIAFWKAFVFSYLNTALVFVHPSSGWLLRHLLLFSDCFAVPVLLWLWIRLSGPDSRTPFRIFSGALGALVLIGCLDFRFISPFLSNLLLN